MPTDPREPDRPVPAEAVARLRDRVRGRVILRTDEAYPWAHEIWNRDRQQRPVVIIAAGSAADAEHAVRFARARGLPIAVRGGGYSPAGLSSCNGVVLDLRGLRQVQVDPGRQRVLVQAGALWGDVDVATQRFGQVAPGAAMAGLGVAGSTLNGGFGNLRRAYGLACDNLIGAAVVGPDGAEVVTSGDEHPELLWGLRGGGGNFGVVTSMTFRLRSLPHPVVAGTVFFRAEHTPAVLRFYRDWARHLREDVTTGVVFLRAGPLGDRGPVPGLDPHTPVVGVSLTCAGGPGPAEPVIAPLRAAAPVLHDTVTVLPYAAVQRLPDAAYPNGLNAAMDSGYLDEIDDDVIAALCERHAALPSSTCELQLHHMGGAVGRVAWMSTAVPNRNAPYFFSILARWDAPAAEAAHREWSTGTSRRLQPLRVGGANAGMRSAAMSSIDAYGAERYLRLAALKRRFDPDNVFTGNQNVTPLV